MRRTYSSQGPGTGIKCRPAALAAAPATAAWRCAKQALQIPAIEAGQELQYLMACERAHLDLLPVNDPLEEGHLVHVPQVDVVLQGGRAGTC